VGGDGRPAVLTMGRPWRLGAAHVGLRQEAPPQGALEVIPAPPPLAPVKTVAIVIVVLVAIVWLCESTGVFGGGALRLR
jgi:hypothetical protein